MVLHNTWRKTRTNPNDDYLITRKWELTKEAQRLHIDCYMIYMFLKLLQQKKTQTLNIIIAMIFCASCCCTNIVVPLYKIHIYSLFHLHLSRYITNQFNDSSQLHLDWWLNRPSALVDHEINAKGLLARVLHQYRRGQRLNPGKRELIQASFHFTTAWVASLTAMKQFYLFCTSLSCRLM